MFLCDSLRDGSIGGHIGLIEDAALSVLSVLVAVAADVDVSLFAPRLSPRVLDLPVLVIAVRAIAHDQHTVVDARSARSRQHTRTVMLKRRLIRLDPDRHTALGSRALQRRRTVRRHRLIPLIRIVFSTTAARTARSILSIVFVVALRAQSALLRTRHLTAVAARAAVRFARAIHEFLLRQRVESARLNRILTLHRARRRESPARTALTLVLHGSHHALRRPIDRFGSLNSRVLAHMA